MLAVTLTIRWLVGERRLGRKRAEAMS
jgi:hypothetical protein